MFISYFTAWGFHRVVQHCLLGYDITILAQLFICIGDWLQFSHEIISWYKNINACMYHRFYWLSHRRPSQEKILRFWNNIYFYLIYPNNRLTLRWKHFAFCKDSSFDFRLHVEQLNQFISIAISLALVTNGKTQECSIKIVLPPIGFSPYRRQILSIAIWLLWSPVFLSCKHRWALETSLSVRNDIVIN